MAGVIQELQFCCANCDGDATHILRKAYIVARKLKLTDFQTWIDDELKGYANTESMPEYRKVSGMIYALWINGSSIPVQVPSEIMDALGHRWIVQSIPEIVSMIENNDNKSFHIPYVGNVNQMICELTGQEAQYYLSVGKDQFHGIIEEVINTILRWSLLLEENGIEDDQLSFSLSDIEKAKAIPPSDYCPQLIFKESVGSVQIQMNNTNSTQQIDKQ